MAAKYDVGDLVWAKMRGYPPWPAKVVPPPRSSRPSASKPYFVFFYGTHEIAWMASKDMQPYYEYQELNKKQAHRPGLGEAIQEIEEDPCLSNSDDQHLLEQLMKPKVKGRGRPRLHKNNSVCSSTPVVGRKRRRGGAIAQGVTRDHVLSVAKDNAMAPRPKRRGCMPANGPTTGCDILALAESSAEGEVNNASDLTSVAVKTETVDENLVESLGDRNPEPVEVTHVEPAPCRRSTRLKQSTMLYEPVQVPPVARRGRRRGGGTADRSVKWNRKKIYARSPQRTVKRRSALGLLSPAPINRVIGPEGAWLDSPELKDVRRLNVPQEQSMVYELGPRPETILRVPVSLFWPDMIGLTETKPVVDSREHPPLQRAADPEARTQAQSPLPQAQSPPPQSPLPQAQSPPPQSPLPQAQSPPPQAQSPLPQARSPLPQSQSTQLSPPPPSSQASMLQPSPVKLSSVQTTALPPQTTPISTPTIQSQPLDKLSLTCILPRVTSQGMHDATPTTQLPTPPDTILPATSNVSTSSQFPIATQSSVCNPVVASSIIGSTDSLRHSLCSTATVQQSSLSSSVVQLAESLVKSTRDQPVSSVTVSHQLASPAKPVMIRVVSEASPVMELPDVQRKCSQTRCDVQVAEIYGGRLLLNRPASSSNESCDGDLSAQGGAVVRVNVLPSELSQEFPVARTAVAQSSPTKPRPYQTRRRHEPSTTDKVGFVEQLTARYSARKQGWNKRSEVKASPDATDVDDRREKGTRKDQSSHELAAEKEPEGGRESTVLSIQDSKTACVVESVPGGNEVPIMVVKLKEPAKEKTVSVLQRTVMDGKGIGGVAKNAEAQRSCLQESGIEASNSTPSNENEVAMVREGGVAVVTRSLVQEQAQLPETTTRACSQQVERASVQEEPSKKDGQTPNVLLIADEASPLVPQTNSFSSVIAPSAMDLQTEEGFFQKNSLASQGENRLHGPTENKTTDRNAESEAEHSGVEEAMKTQLNRPPPLFPIRPSMSIVDALKLFNSNIKSSLVLQHIDTQQALKQLRDLLELNFGKEDIQQVPDLVYTLRKARMFKSNSRVKSRADEAYSKIKGLYLNGVTQPKRSGPKKVASITPKPGRGRGRPPIVRKRPQSIVSMINQRTSSAKNTVSLPGQEPVASSESKVYMSDDKLATDDTMNHEEDRNHSNDVSDQPTVIGEPHNVEKAKELPCRRRNQRRSTRTKVNYNEMAGGDSDGGNGVMDDQIVPEL